ncbi:hypothetical protein BJV77DRAFT_963013 [Russula vinacea]|nr:hypothetical protein BJV77DRAFT_963013 [Russula vinacea]
MSETSHRDFEEESEENKPGMYGVQAQSAPNQQSQPPQPLKGEPNFGDSSGPLFSIYSDATKKEDNKMTDRWKADADGILFFTGLFSAATAALLAVTVQDLRPNSQDTSAFYLGNIYGVLADPNATRSSIPSPVAKPPPFSPPRYAIWVNSLWFLSLVMSLSCALWATSLQQWARRYIRLTQPAQCQPEKRARMRAFFAKGVEKMHIPWAVEGLPALLHLSLFLFLGGLVVFLFNINHEVFIFVVWWLGFSQWRIPYYTPLSIPAWFSYAGTLCVTFEVLASITSSYRTSMGYRNLRDRYRRWMLGGVEKIAEETASEPSSDLDIGILDWTISALGDDDSLETFFEAISGFFKSKLVLLPGLPDDISRRLSDTLNGFLNRTLSSNSVIAKVKRHRLDITLNAIDFIHVSKISSIFATILVHWDQVPQTVEIGHAVARWCTSDDQYIYTFAQYIVAKVLATLRERDDRWLELAARVYGLSEHDLRVIVAHGDDSVSFAILIQITRKAFRSGPWHPFGRFWGHLPKSTYAILFLDCSMTSVRSGTKSSKSKQPRVWHPNSPTDSPSYVTLHGTDVAPPAFSASTDRFEPILLQPSSYPSCDIANHGLLPLPTQSAHSPDAPHHHSTSGGGTLSLQVNEASTTAGTPSLSETSQIESNTQAAAATSLALPVRVSRRPTDASSLGAVAAAMQVIPLSTTLSHPLEGATLRDIVAEPDTTEFLSTASMPGPTPTLVPVPASTPPVLNKSLESYDPGAAASPSNPLLTIPSVGEFSIPTSLPPSHVPSPNAESLAPLSNMTPSRPTGNLTPPSLRDRGLVTTGNMCFANAVLQLLVHSPPFWNLIKELGDLNRQSGTGVPETGGGWTPLVDATVRFFEEFTFNEKGPPTEQAAMGKPMENEEEKKENEKLFEPTYMYDAMNEKKQLKSFLNGQQQDAEEFFRLYLDALDDELLAQLACIGGHKSDTAAPGVEERQVSQSGDTESGKRGLMAESVDSPLMRIFGGKFRSIMRTPNQPDTVRIEDWRSLQLDIQHDSVHAVQDALARISHEQTVQPGLSGFSEASQQVLIEALPSVLVLHLKRFLYDNATNGIFKISKSVQFGPELEIPPEIMASVDGKSPEPVHYKLYGVLYHRGASTGSRHYTVDVLHPNGDSGDGKAWLHVDDETVGAVGHRSSDNERESDHTQTL